MKKKNGVLFVLVLLFLGFVFGFFVLEYTSTRAQSNRVEISNVSSGSFTVTWRTKMASKGVVLVVPKEDILPFKLGLPWVDVYHDSRDVKSAELENVNASMERIDQRESLDIYAEDFVTEVVNVKDGKYFLHHVEVKGLSEGSEYEVFVGDGLFFNKVGSILSPLVVKTFNIGEDVSSPIPAYGSVRDAGALGVGSNDLGVVRDGVVYVELFDDISGARSNLLSSALNGEGNWYMDISDARDSEGERFVEKYLFEVANIMAKIVVDGGPLGRWEKVVSGRELSPAEVLVLDDGVNANVDGVLKRITSLKVWFSSLFGDVKADSGVDTACLFGSTCGCIKRVSGVWASCSCDSGELAKRKCTGQDSYEITMTSATSGNCGASKNGAVSPGKDGACWKCNGGKWEVTTEYQRNGDAKCVKNSNGGSGTTGGNNLQSKCEDSGGEFEKSGLISSCSCPNGYFLDGGECFLKKGQKDLKPTLISEENCKNAGGIYRPVDSISTNQISKAIYGCVCPNGKSMVNDSCGGGNIITRKCLVFDTLVEPEAKVYFYNKENEDGYLCSEGKLIEVENAPCAKIKNNFGTVDAELENTYCIVDESKVYSNGRIKLMSPGAIAVVDMDTISKGSQCKNPKGCVCLEPIAYEVMVANDEYCLEVNSCGKDSSKGKVCNLKGYRCAGNSCNPPSSSLPLNNIKTSVLAEGDIKYDEYILNPDGYINNIEEGRYIADIDGQQYLFVVLEDNLNTNEGKILLFKDNNNNGTYDEGKDTKISDISSTVKIKTIEKIYKYKLKEGFNFISLPLLSSYEDSRSASGLLKRLNEVYGNTIYSISKYDGRWKIVGQNGDLYDNNDFQLIPGQGYVFKVKEDIEIAIPGFPVQLETSTDKSPITFSTGWNLIGLYGTNLKQYTAKTLIQGINQYTTNDFTADNVSKWDTSAQKYEGYQMDSTGSYGFDYPLLQLSSYFVRIVQGSGNWQPEIQK